MGEHTRGMWYGVAAYVIWGLSPLFWNLVDGVGAVDLLIYRVAFALPILAIAITASKAWNRTIEDYDTWRARLITVVAAVLLAVNWGLFLWAVTNGHVVEASLGYFINPLVSVALGVVVLHERLRPLQWTAVGIAAIGVVGMGIRVGAIPWVSLSLAVSFGVYGLLKKRDAAARPLSGLFGEVFVLAIPAVIAFVILATNGQDAPIDISPTRAMFLLGTGAITVAPLLLFGAAVQRIRLSTVGILQYIAPTLQLAIGLAVLGEALTMDRLIGFVMVWIALGLYTFDNVRWVRSQVAVVT